MLMVLVLVGKPLEAESRRVGNDGCLSNKSRYHLPQVMVLRQDKGHIGQCFHLIFFIYFPLRLPDSFRKTSPCHTFWQVKSSLPHEAQAGDSWCIPGGIEHGADMGLQWLLPLAHASLTMSLC